MIIACPQCDTRFVVPSTIFADGGRKVRCASCKHEWYQEDPDDNSTVTEMADSDPFDKDEDFSSHLEAANTRGKESVAQNASAKTFDGETSSVSQGIKLAVAACVTVLFLYFAYAMLKPSLVMGEGLAFNDITLQTEGDVLVLQGEIVNTVNEKRGVPSLKIISLMEGGVEGDVKLVAPEKDILESGEILPLSIELSDINPQVRNVTVTFEGVKAGGINAMAPDDTEKDALQESQTVEPEYPVEAEDASHEQPHGGDHH